MRYRKWPLMGDPRELQYFRSDATYSGDLLARGDWSFHAENNHHQRRRFSKRNAQAWDAAGIIVR